jgi:hypothetical protein
MLHKALNHMLRNSRREILRHIIFLIIFVATNDHLEEQLNSQLVAGLKEGSCATFLCELDSRTRII